MPAERVLEIAGKLAGFGCEEISFGDTTGMANPRQVREFFTAAQALEVFRHPGADKHQNAKQGSERSSSHAGTCRSYYWRTI